MGDPRRFHAFADLIQQYVPSDATIADVAGGRGGLQAALYQRDYRNVTTWDISHRCATPRRGYHYGLFDYRSASRGFDAVLGMHPDAATDHLIYYAAKHKVAAFVCPCCVMPSATNYGGARANYRQWVQHLKGLALQLGLQVIHTRIPIRGRNEVLICF